MKRLPAKFFRSERGIEPVKEWLKTLDREDCRIIGSDSDFSRRVNPYGLLTSRLESYCPNAVVGDAGVSPASPTTKTPLI
ncbi:MAG: hypothetical protein QNJ18_12440 [Xenococcaceae cyanobacterium MO_167.B52]|nr:hypothetical protein [Xenococcaceae cyanobacterium MO_167.B52]